MDIAITPRRMQGQSLVEAVIVIPIFGAFLLGIFQGVLVYRAKSDLDYATMQAARSGATSFAEKSAMIDGLARGLAPLYAHNSSSSEVLKAYLKAKTDIQIGQAATIQIVSPTKAAFDDFKQPEFDGVEAIPNDRLSFRGSSIGNKSHLTIQDANLLKIKVTYRYPLIAPFIDRIIGTLDPARTLADGHPVYSLAIEAQATALMQTPIRDVDLLPSGSTQISGSGTGGNQNSGGSSNNSNGSGGGNSGSPNNSNTGGGSTGGGSNGGGSDGAGHPPCTAG